MEITQLSLDDHHEQRRLFCLLVQAARSDVRSLAVTWRRLSALLDVHAEAEEQIFEPALRRLGPGRR